MGVEIGGNSEKGGGSLVAPKKDSRRSTSALSVRSSSVMPRSPLGNWRKFVWDCVALVKAFRAVMDGIHRGEGGEEGLGGADVAGGTVAADMLLPGLEGEAVGGTTGAVFGDSDQATREEALVC